MSCHCGHALTARLGLVMAAGKRHSALMFMDLDNFKPLNDTHGHFVGDLLLVEVARRITSCIRAVDIVSRFGGDEFVVILTELVGDKAEGVRFKVVWQRSGCAVECLVEVLSWLQWMSAGRYSVGCLRHGAATGSGACGFGGKTRAGLMFQYANTADARLCPQSPVT